jgi:hypothetical protein
MAEPLTAACTLVRAAGCPPAGPCFPPAVPRNCLPACLPSFCCPPRQVEELRKQIEVLSQNHEREVDRKDAMLQVRGLIHSWG